VELRLAAVGAVYTTTDRTVHRLVTAIKIQRAQEKAGGHRHPRDGAIATLSVPHRWMTIGGALPSHVLCHTDMSGALIESCYKGVTALFACGLINRGGGRPWPLSFGTSNSCIHPLIAEHTTALTCTLDFIILSEFGEPLVHCLVF
jgi:hypothetical protein